MVTDCQSVLPALTCNNVSNDPVEIDSFNTCINIAVACIVSLKMCVGVAILYINLVSTPTGDDNDDRDLLCVESVTNWIVISSSELS